MSDTSSNSGARPIAVLVDREGLGDSLLKFPFLRAIRRGFPGRPVWWIATHQTSMANELAPFVTTLIDRVVDHAGLTGRSREVRDRLRQLPPFEMVFEFAHAYSERAARPRAPHPQRLLLLPARLCALQQTPARPLDEAERHRRAHAEPGRRGAGQAGRLAGHAGGVTGRPRSGARAATRRSTLYRAGDRQPGDSQELAGRALHRAGAGAGGRRPHAGVPDRPAGARIAGSVARSRPVRAVPRGNAARSRAWSGSARIRNRAMPPALGGGRERQRHRPSAGRDRNAAGHAVRADRRGALGAVHDRRHHRAGAAVRRRYDGGDPGRAGAARG